MTVVVRILLAASYRIRRLRPAGRGRHGVCRVAGPGRLGTSRPMSRALRPASRRCPSVLPAGVHRAVSCAGRAVVGFAGRPRRTLSLAGLGTLVARALRTRRVVERDWWPTGSQRIGPADLVRCRYHAPARPPCGRCAAGAVPEGVAATWNARPIRPTPGLQRLDLYRHRSRRDGARCLSISTAATSLGFQEPRVAAAALPAGRKRLDRHQRQLRARSGRVVPRRPRGRQAGPGLGR